ncbi:hypothetical protein BDY17DRAFT_296394 [Neohortaea acidophila]|uniref:Uncharacterized protein n=1 Tax=Neohortaea acidophila TaxID=245834 RepID=A0A6A6PRZ0_9PEZI|nr:uncharacterized protein BDY17DRAFT_296394 [Neohortaea acidophila]KAF2482869.1 hypothetical protein BDY17DRAFT_296394 [Neohortaea acidophila]
MRSPKSELRVRFASLTDPDRRQGRVFDKEEIASSRIPATQGNADEKPSEQSIPTWDPETTVEATRLFRHIVWIEEAHPGRRITVDVHECEAISPRTTVVKVPAWSLEADDKWFRQKVQPRRHTGRRKPGMTTRKPVTENERHGDACVVQLYNPSKSEVRHFQRWHDRSDDKRGSGSLAFERPLPRTFSLIMRVSKCRAETKGPDEVFRIASDRHRTNLGSWYLEIAVWGSRGNAETTKD